MKRIHMVTSCHLLSYLAISKVHDPNDHLALTICTTPEPPQATAPQQGQVKLEEGREGETILASPALSPGELPLIYTSNQHLLCSPLQQAFCDRFVLDLL